LAPAIPRNTSRDLNNPPQKKGGTKKEKGRRTATMIFGGEATPKYFRRENKTSRIASHRVKLSDLIGKKKRQRRETRLAASAKKKERKEGRCPCP